MHAHVMEGRDGRSGAERGALPLPVARLRRRSLNAKSSKDRHDTAFHAWEVSVRLAVAAARPRDVSRLRRGSLGEWARSLELAPTELKGPGVLALYAHLTEVGLGKRSQPRAVLARELLDALVAYRNRVVGHGSVHEPSFYDEAGARLLTGLEETWSADVFLPAGASLQHCDAVALTSDGGRRARLLDLGNETPLVLDPLGSPVPELVRPRRLYLRRGEEWIDLHPWALYDEERERLYCFHALGRRAEFLDFGSGQFLRGEELERLAPGVEDELRGLFAGTGAPAPEPAPAKEQHRFGDFRILGKLGEGGMGSVYLASQLSLDRLVALKMLHPGAGVDPVAEARFEREIEALSRCEHPNVVKILASGVEEGTRYYAMEYVEGADLRRVARALPESGSFELAVSSACEAASRERRERFRDLPQVTRRTPPAARTHGQRHRDLARYFRDAARGVQHLHERGIVHRDLSPANLMVTVGDARAVVMDLGLALLEDASVSLTRDRATILGTLRYLPPEQLQRNLLTVDRRADVYALGAVLYELLTDRPLFDGDTEVRLIEQVLREEPAPLRRVDPRIPRDLATIVEKAIQKDPRQRYESAEGLAEDLQAFLEERPIRARPATVAYLTRKWVERNRSLAAVLGVAFLLLAAGSWLALADRARSQRELALNSDLFQMTDLVERAEGLWLPDLARVGEAQRWIEEARLLAARRNDHERRIEELASPDEEVIAADSARSEQLERERQFLEAVDRLTQAKDGLIDHVATRVARASEVHERSLTSPEALDRWQRAVASIADPNECPEYRGLRIQPQFGLLPLRQDPASGLWEFAHCATGEIPEIGADGSYEIRPDSSIVLVLLPPASTWIGAQRSDRSRPNFDPAAAPNDLTPQEVEIEAFFLSKYEMSVSQWKRATGGQIDSSPEATNPVENVSWNDASRWLPRLGLDLPTEAQWEYGARAAVDAPCFVPENELRFVANLGDLTFKNEFKERAQGNEEWEDGFARLCPVNAMRPNPFGLHNVFGNLWELCRDVHGKPGWRDMDVGVFRGGGRINLKGYARAACREDSRSRDFRWNFGGVRPARALEPAR